ncbi:UDP-N-acetylmuramoyl-tripeptide--D-alanyl-D-alanine ligase [Paenibacillus sp. sptzw28]|uniref:UDP-N-acetylmuramoyl-tripeptide--D-alanyl-D- alanine ligase n=1 Tax=Paenibacillus sp. sptzw28 TaxID=715179 RepID=UPI001C6E6D39|nr:UDP-N-acetylmuramoyl-tripeptide--D-alanyl-D-alanine ligase [Paenibacillus sp. sptzw28]QYR21485.1 UDP-N-acetylmuramoyl-tripeptide--D-alanyl-D-alanine ligase [Paenibacillus sp. sptzw28]
MSESRPIIAVTGSAGKTTTKEMIASVLRRQWNIFKSRSNWNTPSATRKNARLIKGSHQAVVLEFGMLRKGQIRKHCSLIKPTIGIITNVGTAHIGNVGNRVEGIARAKSELIRYMDPAGTIVLNADDRGSRLISTKGFKGTVIKIGIRSAADYKAEDVQPSEKGISFRVKLDEKEEDTEFFIPCLGIHNVYNALNAIAVTHRAGFSASEIKEGLARYPIPYRRLVRTELPGGITLIDDTFSSNPDATKAALDVLAAVPNKHKVAVIGYMKDLGKRARKSHLEVGKYAAKKEITRLYTIGALAKHIAAGAKDAGFPAGRIRSFSTRPGLHKALSSAVRPDTAILVKGTHLLKLERTVKYLKRHFSGKTKSQ